jgi:hypothetical protein
MTWGSLGTRVLTHPHICGNKLDKHPIGAIKKGYNFGYHPGASVLTQSHIDTNYDILLGPHCSPSLQWCLGFGVTIPE